MRAAMVALDPRTGAVKAYVGGPNFRYFKYDMAKQGKRQIGSTIKPFVYTFAIDHLGMTPCTMVPNLPVTIETANGVACACHTKTEKLLNRQGTGLCPFEQAVLELQKPEDCLPVIRQTLARLMAGKK